MDPQILAELARFDSATIANAIERFNVRDRLDGYTSLELRCQFPELAPVVGYAVTATAKWTSGPDHLDTAWADLLDAIDAAPRPSIVVIGWDGPDATTGCVVGDMVATGLDRIGVVAIATDSAIRDRSGMRLRAPRMQVFARGTVSSHGRTHLIRIGQPAVVGGLRIGPGALLHGDENGLVEIPLEVADRVAAVAAEVRATEEAYFSALTEPGISFRDIREFLDPGH
jgi:regulator of RNase E activity RraA